MEQFLTEALKAGKGVELGDALTVGGMVTGVGLGIVFGVLVILMIVLMLFKVIFYKEEPKKKITMDEETVQNVQIQEVVNSVSQNSINNDELIAVLTAAIAASLNTSTYNLRIKSYRRIETKKPAWNKAGINETINSRF